MLRSILPLLCVSLFFHTAIFAQTATPRLTIAGQINNHEGDKKLILVKDRWHMEEPTIGEDGRFYVQTPSFAGGMIYFIYDQLYTDVLVREGDSVSNFSPGTVQSSRFEVRSLAENQPIRVVLTHLSEHSLSPVRATYR